MNIIIKNLKSKNHHTITISIIISMIGILVTAGLSTHLVFGQHDVRQGISGGSVAREGSDGSDGIGIAMDRIEE